MKVLRKGFEKEVTCPKCKAVLLYVKQDIHLIGDMENDYNYCVKCPECGTEIPVSEAGDNIKWVDMETREAHCYNCCLFDWKNNKCKNIDLCKNPKQTYKGFYIKK